MGLRPLVCHAQMITHLPHRRLGGRERLHARCLEQRKGSRTLLPVLGASKLLRMRMQCLPTPTTCSRVELHGSKSPSFTRPPSLQEAATSSGLVGGGSPPAHLTSWHIRGSRCSLGLTAPWDDSQNSAKRCRYDYSSVIRDVTRKWPMEGHVEQGLGGPQT